MSAKAAPGADPRDPDEDTVRSWLNSLSNWGRWGENDEFGTLNYVHEEERAAAARLATGKASISCSLPISFGRPPHAVLGPNVAVHPHPSWTRPLRFVVQDGSEAPTRWTRHSAYDAFLLAPHGPVMTHLDAPGHTVLGGCCYNNITASTVETPGEYKLGTIEAVKHGIMSRGVLLDVPALYGRTWLDDGEAIYPEDLEACEAQAKLQVRRGDILFIRTGYRKRLPEGPDGRHAHRPGLQAACLPWLHEREVAVVASDVAVDLEPHGYDGLGKPIHTVGMWAMGLWLLDNCGLEVLGSYCHGEQQWEFMCVLAPLVLTGGTGSPTNPLAIF